METPISTTTTLPVDIIYTPDVTPDDVDVLLNQEQEQVLIDVDMPRFNTLKQLLDYTEELARAEERLRTINQQVYIVTTPFCFANREVEHSRGLSKCELRELLDRRWDELGYDVSALPTCGCDYTINNQRCDTCTCPVACRDGYDIYVHPYYLSKYYFEYIEKLSNIRCSLDDDVPFTYKLLCSKAPMITRFCDVDDGLYYYPNGVLEHCEDLKCVFFRDTYEKYGDVIVSDDEADDDKSGDTEELDDIPSFEISPRYSSLLKKRKNHSPAKVLFKRKKQE